MNYAEAQQMINGSMALVAEKFEETFPDTFLKSKTTKPEEYKNANPCMYSWYMAAVRGISAPHLSPQYSQTLEETLDGDWSCIHRFFKDMMATDDFLHFIIEHVRIQL